MKDGTRTKDYLRFGVLLSLVKLLILSTVVFLT